MFARLAAIILKKKVRSMPEIDRPTDLEIFAHYPWAFGSNPVQLGEGIVACAPDHETDDKAAATYRRLNSAI